MILCVCPNPSIDTLVTVDDLAPGQVHRAIREQRFPGGKGVHVALAAAELGSKVTLLGFWAGPSGKWIREQCEAAGVHCMGPELDGWSRSCITFKSGSAYNETELLGVGPQVGTNQLREFEQDLESCAMNADVVTLSGSWPAGSPSDSYANLLAILKAQNRLSMLDCTGELLRIALRESPDVVHLNRKEAEERTGESDPLAAARK